MLYEKVQNIGRGGFGRVDKVVDDSGEYFAMKTFDPAPYIPMAAYDRLRKRFRREVTIQYELASASIMPVLHHNLTGNSPWFVMPLAERTYEEQIQNDKVSGKVDIDAIADVLNGLEYLHDMGFVHRDLNPKNILLVDGTWRLSDFGAVLPPSGQTVTLTEETTIYTEHYCAPEQRHDFHSVKAPADIFSFGCILHDIFGDRRRTPYSRVTAAGPMGAIIEKCTETNAIRRPRIHVLKGMVIDQLIEIGGHCKVEDKESAEWLDRLSTIEDWKEGDFDQFARFFDSLDVEEKADDHEGSWISSLSTPFLTRLPANALIKIVERNDGLCDAILEKYCLWVRQTNFLFVFADTIATRLAAIFDNGRPEHKAMAFAAMVCLGASHNRWYVMRKALMRCDKQDLDDRLAQRLRIEIISEELKVHFAACVDVVQWDNDRIHSELRKCI